MIRGKNDEYVHSFHSENGKTEDNTEDYSNAVRYVGLHGDFYGILPYPYV
jgi:hypothetical protein